MSYNSKILFSRVSHFLFHPFFCWLSFLFTCCCIAHPIHRFKAQKVFSSALFERQKIHRQPSSLHLTCSTRTLISFTPLAHLSHSSFISPLTFSCQHESLHTSRQPNTSPIYSSFPSTFALFNTPFTSLSPLFLFPLLVTGLHSPFSLHRCFFIFPCIQTFFWASSTSIAFLSSIHQYFNIPPRCSKSHSDKLVFYPVRSPTQYQYHKECYSFIFVFPHRPTCKKSWIIVYSDVREVNTEWRFLVNIFTWFYIFIYGQLK